MLSERLIELLNALPVEDAPANERRKRALRVLHSVGYQIYSDAVKRSDENMRHLGKYLMALSTYTEQQFAPGRKAVKDRALMAAERITL